MIDPNYSLPKPLQIGGEGQNAQAVDKSSGNAGLARSGVQADLQNVPQARKDGLAAVVNDLTPGGIVPAGDVAERLAAVDKAAKAMADPAFDFSAVVGNIAKFLARAMIESAGEQRQNALADRLAARETAKAELISQAGKMEKAADKMAAGAITNLVAGMVGGAMSIGGSAFSTVKGMGQLAEMKGVLGSLKTANADAVQLGKLEKLAPGMSKLAPDAIAQNKGTLSGLDKQFNALNSQMQVTTAKSQIVTSSGDVTKMLGSTTDARLQAEAKREDAGGARDAADAQVAQQQAELKKDVQDTMNEMIKQIINFLKEMKDAEVDAMRALTRV
ncbi:MAG: hypothetical protein ACT6U0_10175 [Shinella sp.]|uniref:hypothetical protein n=1 Tax=Shinella sp. TaxID=1870904 RepID=UPI004036F503